MRDNSWVFEISSQNGFPFLLGIYCCFVNNWLIDEDKLFFFSSTRLEFKPTVVLTRGGHITIILARRSSCVLIFFFLFSLNIISHH